MYRVEDKFACDEGELRILQSRISGFLKLDVNQKGAQGYTVTSVYFDDINDSCYWSTVDGNSKREKYRIRIYNNSLESIKLEVKYKQYNRIRKESVSITAEQMERLLDGKTIETNTLSANSPITLFNTAIKTRGLRPKVIVEYDRSAYIFDAGNVRITFDRNIRASKEIENFGQTKLHCSLNNEMDSVLEVKYDEFLPDFIAQLLELGNMRQTSCSKYKLCREREKSNGRTKCN